MYLQSPPPAHEAGNPVRLGRCFFSASLSGIQPEVLLPELPFAAPLARASLIGSRADIEGTQIKKGGLFMHTPDSEGGPWGQVNPEGQGSTRKARSDRKQSSRPGFS